MGAKEKFLVARDSIWLPYDKSLLHQLCSLGPGEEIDVISAICFWKHWNQFLCPRDSNFNLKIFYFTSVLIYQDDTSLVSGVECSCFNGFSLVNNSSCRDLDECANPGSCSQRCFNSIGSFTCKCTEGYKLEYDQRHCKATGKSLNWNCF